MQRLIQTKVLGKMFWKRHAEKRLLASSDGIVRVVDIIGFRTKVNNPSAELRHLHPIFQNHGMPSVHSYAANQLEIKSAPPTPTRTTTGVTDSSIHLKDAANSTSHVITELDEPIKQFLQHQSHLQSVLEITDVRGHRAARMKQARDSKLPEQLTPIQREEQKLVLLLCWRLR
jgi:hypothetical protein